MPSSTCPVARARVGAISSCGAKPGVRARKSTLLSFPFFCNLITGSTTTENLPGGAPTLRWWRLLDRLLDHRERRPERLLDSGADRMIRPAGPSCCGRPPPPRPCAVRGPPRILRYGYAPQRRAAGRCRASRCVGARSIPVRARSRSLVRPSGSPHVRRRSERATRPVAPAISRIPLAGSTASGGRASRRSSKRPLLSPSFGLAEPFLTFARPPRSLRCPRP